MNINNVFFLSAAAGSRTKSQNKNMPDNDRCAVFGLTQVRKDTLQVKEKQRGGTSFEGSCLKFMLKIVQDHKTSIHSLKHKNCSACTPSTGCFYWLVLKE